MDSNIDVLSPLELTSAYISVIKLKKCSFPSCAYNNVEKQKIALTVELLLVQMFV